MKMKLENGRRSSNRGDGSVFVLEGTISGHGMCDRFNGNGKLCLSRKALSTWQQRLTFLYSVSPDAAFDAFDLFQNPQALICTHLLYSGVSQLTCLHSELMNELGVLPGDTYKASSWRVQRDPQGQGFRNKIRCRSSDKFSLPSSSGLPSHLDSPRSFESALQSFGGGLTSPS